MISHTIRHLTLFFSRNEKIYPYFWITEYMYIFFQNEKILVYNSRCLGNSIKYTYLKRHQIMLRHYKCHKLLLSLPVSAISPISNSPNYSLYLSNVKWSRPKSLVNIIVHEYRNMLRYLLYDQSQLIFFLQLMIEWEADKILLHS